MVIDQSLLAEKIMLSHLGVEVMFNVDEACSLLEIDPRRFKLFCAAGLGPHQLSFAGVDEDLHIGLQRFYSRQRLDQWRTMIFDKLQTKTSTQLKKIRKMALAMP